MQVLGIVADLFKQNQTGLLEFKDWVLHQPPLIKIQPLNPIRGLYFIFLKCIAF